MDKGNFGYLSIARVTKLGGIWMEKGKLLPISLICLSISLVISSMLIANGLKKSSEYIATSISNSYNGNFYSPQYMYSLMLLT